MTRKIRPGTRRRISRVRLDLCAGDLAIVERAAQRRGQSRTGFVREAVVRAARRALEEHSLIRMNSEGFKAFQAAVATPAEVVPSLIELFQRRSPWDPGDST